MNQFRRIQLAFDAAEREGGGTPVSRATPAAPTAHRARRRRKMDPKSTNATGIPKNPTKVRPGEGETLIAVMGATGSGKSYFCRAATGDDGVGVGDGPGSRTLEPTRHQVMLRTDDGERLVTLLDIPGFYYSSHNNTAIPNEKTVALRDTYAQGRKFSGVLYLQLISNIPAEDSEITDAQLNVFQELCGDNTGMLKNVILASNRWDLVENQEVGIQRQAELETNPRYWKPICLQGSQVRRFEGTRESALELIHLVMHNAPPRPKVRHENNSFSELSSGRAVDPESAEIEKLREKYEQPLGAVMKEMKAEYEKSLGEERKLRKEERERMENEIALLKTDIDARAQAAMAKFSEMMYRHIELAISEMQAEYEKLLSRERKQTEYRTAQLKVDTEARAQADMAEVNPMKGKQELAFRFSSLEEKEKVEASNERVQPRVGVLGEGPENHSSSEAKLPIEEETDQLLKVEEGGLFWSSRVATLSEKLHDWRSR